MWYFASLFILIILVSIITILGRPVCELFPFKTRPSAKLLLSPVIGLSILTLVATFWGWVIGATPHICIPTTLLLMGVAFYFDRNKKCLLKHLSVLWGYSIVSSGGIFFCLLRYECFDPFNDAFTYLVHSQWLQYHAYREPALASGLFPALSQVVSYQQIGARMGASFFLAWIQATLAAPMSYLVYPVAITLPLLAGCLVIGYCASINSFGRYKPFIIAFFASISLNGFAFGVLYGFLAQTYGVTFALSSLLTLGIANAHLSNSMRWKESFLLTIPCTLLFSCTVYCYSEIVPFTIFAFIIALVYPLLKRNCTQGWVKFCSAFFAGTAIFIVWEIPRAFKAILLQSKALVGWPVPWHMVEFIALSFGFRSGPEEDMLPGMLPGPVWLLSSPAISLAILVILLIPLYLNRKALVSNRFSQLLPCITFISICCVFFLYYRYACPSPWPVGKGQSWNQFKIANWVSPFCMVLVGLSVLQATKRLYLHRILLFILILCCLSGLARNYFLADPRTRIFRSEVGSESPFSELRALRNYTKNFVKAGQRIYLELWYIHYQLRQIVTYFLYDLELASDLNDDGYFGSIPKDQRSIPLSSSTFLIHFLPHDELRDLTPRFGNMVFTKTPDYIVKLKSVEGGYDREKDGSGWWYWTSNSLKFEYEVEYVKRPESMFVRFEYLSLSGRSIKVVAQGTDSSKEIVVNTPGGWGSCDFEISSPRDLLNITFVSPEPAARLSDLDSRMGKFMVKNITVSSN